MWRKGDDFNGPVQHSTSSLAPDPYTFEPFDHTHFAQHSTSGFGKVFPLSWEQGAVGEQPFDLNFLPVDPEAGAMGALQQPDQEVYQGLANVLQDFLQYGALCTC